MQNDGPIRACFKKSELPMRRFVLPEALQCTPRRRVLRAIQGSDRSSASHRAIPTRDIMPNRPTVRTLSANRFGNPLEHTSVQHRCIGRGQAPTSGCRPIHPPTRASDAPLRIRAAATGKSPPRPPKTNGPPGAIPQTLRSNRARPGNQELEGPLGGLESKSDGQGAADRSIRTSSDP